MSSITDDTTSQQSEGGNVLTLLPAYWRRVIYIVYGLLALVGTAVSAYYGALPQLDIPYWVTGGLAVLGALAAPISVLAATNVKADPTNG
ncbi:hypothetical protein [Microlunatus ginsengisoli]|jgi:hypothetical protein|uniref:Holin n=1 Tax=Microlunatus ginsengisoli TaxID=363863 RepID=A0ABP6ZTB8_9ACTN